MIHFFYSYLLYDCTLIWQALKNSVLLHWRDTAAHFLSLFLPHLLSRQMRRSTPELVAAAEHRDSRDDDHYHHYRYHYYSC